MAQGTSRATGAVGGFTEGHQTGSKEHQALACYQFDIVHL